MTKWCKVTGLLALFLIMTVSCRQLYTTSFGTAFARDGLTISSKTSIADLLDLANGTEGTDPDAAKEILDVLAGKTPADIVALSVDDKATILELAATAAIDMTAITALATSTGGATIEAALAAFDTSVNLGAINAILADTSTLASAPVDTIVLASAVVLADIASSGTAEQDAMMAIMAGADQSARETLLTNDTTLTPEEKASLSNIINVVAYLETNRPTEGVSFGDFNLLDLLKG